MTSITWKKYEKDMKSDNPDIQRKATDAFLEERDLQLRTSSAARQFEKDRKKELEKNKPLWRKEQDEKKKFKDTAFKNLLKGGSFKQMIKPVRGYILVELPKKEEVETDSGIILSKNVVEEPNEAIVIDCGEDIKDFPCPCKIGNKILFKRGAGLELLLNDKNYKLLYFQDILGIFTNDN